MYCTSNPFYWSFAETLSSISKSLGDFLLTFHSCPIAASLYAIEPTTSPPFPSNIIFLIKPHIKGHRKDE
jgi:hypothetical protein